MYVHITITQAHYTHVRRQARAKARTRLKKPFLLIKQMLNSFNRAFIVKLIVSCRSHLCPYFENWRYLLKQYLKSTKIQDFHKSFIISVK